MKPLIPLYLALLCGALLSPLAQAAAPMYTIELLLFEQLGSHTAEEWPERPGTPDLDRVVDLEPRPGKAADPTAIDGNFTLRPRRELSALADAMERSGGYRILKHVAWRQPSYGEQRTRPIRIEAGAEIPGAWLADAQPTGEAWGATPAAAEPTLSHRQLEGTARVHVGKYLHLELDLLFHRNRPRQPESAAADHTIVVAANQPLMETIRVRNHRRMRSKELHYLDHPVIGALVIAHPFEPEEEAAPVR